MRSLRHLLLLFALCLAPWGSAWAHAALVGSEPADGSYLSTPPPALILRFDEAVTLLDLRLAGPTGAVPLPTVPMVSRGEIRAPLPEGLTLGTYLASFRIASADGHPVSGGIAFGIGNAPERTIAANPGPTANWALAAEALRILLYVGFALGAGGALFRALVAPPPARLRRLMGVAATLGAAAALLGIGVQGGDMLAAPSLRALLDGAVWMEAARSPVFVRGLLLALGLVGVALSCRMAGRAGLWLGGAGALIAAGGFSLAGHAATGGTLSQVLLVAHVLAAAYWLGAFLPLIVLLRSDGAAALPVLRRFAAIAIPVVAVLLLSGAVQAAWRLPEASALVEGRYGLLVLGKAAGAALMLALAALNHGRLTPALAASGSAHGLIRSIATESVVALAVLTVTAVLSMTAPQAGLHALNHEAHAWSGTLVATEPDGLSITLEITPARAGQNRLTLFLAREDGTPLAVPEACLEFSQPQAGVAGIRRPMRAEAEGRLVQEGPELALPGRWAIRLEILVSDFKQVVAILHADLGPPAP